MSKLQIFLATFLVTYVYSIEMSSPQQWTVAHNKYRCMHGANWLMWAKNLQDTAQEVVDQKTAGTLKGHSDGYNAPWPQGPRGENLLSRVGISKRQNWVKAMESWYGEEPNYNYETGQDDGGESGHFTAMIWQGVRSLGCAGVEEQSAETWRDIACHYRSTRTKSGETPNMGGAYTTQVLRKNGKTEEACQTEAEAQWDAWEGFRSHLNTKYDALEPFLDAVHDAASESSNLESGSTKENWTVTKTYFGTFLDGLGSSLTDEQKNIVSDSFDYDRDDKIKREDVLTILDDGRWDEGDDDQDKEDKDDKDDSGSFHLAPTWMAGVLLLAFSVR